MLLSNTCSHKKCVSLISNAWFKQLIIVCILINTKYTQRCVGNCNTFNYLSNRVCILNKTPYTSTFQHLSNDIFFYNLKRSSWYWQVYLTRLRFERSFHITGQRKWLCFGYLCKFFRSRRIRKKLQSLVKKGCKASN